MFRWIDLDALSPMVEFAQEGEKDGRGRARKGKKESRRNPRAGFVPGLATQRLTGGGMSRNSLSFLRFLRKHCELPDAKVVVASHSRDGE